MTSGYNLRQDFDNQHKLKQDKWIFELYIAGMTPHTITAIANLKEFCKKFLPEGYEVTVIDLINQPQLACEKQIFAIPTLIKISPEPVCRSIGDISNPDSLRQQLNLTKPTP